MRSAWLLAAAALAAPVVAQPASDNGAVLAAARAFEYAQYRRDRAGLEAVIAPDFLVAQGSGRIVGRRDYIDGLTRADATVQPVVTTNRMFLRLSADVAIVGAEQRVSGTASGKPFARHFRYSDTLVRRGGRWMVAFLQITPLPL